MLVVGRWSKRVADVVLEFGRSNGSLCQQAPLGQNFSDPIEERDGEGPRGISMDTELAPVQRERRA